MIWLLVYTIAAVLLYVFAVRPILHAVPALVAFYREADTFWQRVWALAWRSATVAWSYVLALIGTLLQAIDTIGDALGDPMLKEQIAAAIGDTRLVGRVLLGISLVTLIARSRSLRKGG